MHTILELHKRTDVAKRSNGPATNKDPRFHGGPIARTLDVVA
ncbi:hypothetical protein SXCC_01115 [Gluconacetobacter sp. SXCC-1]|nr:hypothetical protein SXCC_01115 [Gluconacetobacter sp. SXCC-1]